ncbi:MAG: DUF4838 domain-containing protein [Candidatus Omnitrophica bacterium]|nr:DUF4838 domain-containing protein [Candidatus Omnitrophota bacterium]
MNQPVYLVKKKRPVSVVYLPEKSSEFFQSAVQELIRVIKKATGVKLPITKQPFLEGQGPLIVFLVKPGRKRTTLPANDAFVINCQPDRVEITVERDEIFPVAAARFLQEAVRARWFFPGPLGEDIPRLQDISLPVGLKRYQPDFCWRSLTWRAEPSLRDWEIRNGLMRFPINRGHAYQEILPRRLFRSHPEFFSLICGRRRINPSQMCFSAPGIVDHVFAYLERILWEDPHLLAVSLCPADVDYFCECQKCQKGENALKYYDLYVEEPAYGYGGPGLTSHLSERVFRFTNQIAEKLAEKYPDKYLIVYAYGAYRYPPEGMKIRDNVIIWLTTTCLGWGNPERKKLEIERLKAWRKVARNIVIFEALSNQAWPELPRIAPQLVAISLKTYHRLGVRGFYSQMFGDFGTNLPNYYLAARFVWDTSLSYQKEMAELTHRCFGPAGRAVKEYYQILNQAWKNLTEDGTLEGARSLINPKNEYLHLARLYPKKVLTRARRALEKARRLAGSGLYGRRVDFLLKGWRYTELTMAAIKECLALEDMGFAPFYFSPWLGPDYDFKFYRILIRGKDKRVVIHALNRAISAWEKREEFVKKLAGKNILSESLLGRNRRFDPRPILVKMLAIAEEMRSLSQKGG